MMQPTGSGRGKQKNCSCDFQRLLQHLCAEQEGSERDARGVPKCQGDPEEESKVAPSTGQEERKGREQTQGEFGRQRAAGF